MNQKRIVRIAIVSIVIIFIGLLLFLPRIAPKTDDNKIKIVSTTFPTYDIARALTYGLDVNTKMLVRPGVEIHDYDPSPQDIIDAQSADIFIYIGGESDTWVDKINFSEKTLVIKLIDSVKTTTESDDTDEIDEHIWTSPANYLSMMSYAKGLISAKYPDLKTALYDNLSIYGETIRDLDQNYRNAKIAQPIIVADRFPFRYLVKEYGLDYVAAFPGCAEQTEASAEKVAEIIKAVKDNNAPHIYALDMSDAKIAQAIASSTDVKIRKLYSGHNLSQEDFNSGITMAVIYERNLKALQESK